MASEDDYSLDDELPDEGREYEERHPGEVWGEDFDPREDWGDLPDEWYDMLDEGDWYIYEIDVDIDYTDGA